MKFLRIFYLLLVFGSVPVFAAYNDRVYQGINPIWKTFEGIQDHLGIISLFIPETSTVLEVGAFDGSDSVTLAKRWPRGNIISFEANPLQFRKYQERVQGLSNTLGQNLAVNTYNGNVKFYVCWGTGGKDPVFERASSLLEPSESMKIHYMGPEITLPCVVFDDWCRDNSVSEVDFMWVNLEGFEKQFITSSPNILKTVKVIYTKTNFYNFRKGTTQFSDLHAFLQNQGFRMIAHWYHEGLQGDAIFVRNSILKAKGM